MKPRTTSRSSFVAVSLMITVWNLTQAAAQAPDQERSQAQAKQARTDDRETWTIKTKEQATSRVRRILGLPDRSPLKLTAGLVTLKEDNTPFLNGQIVDRPIWQVVIADWKLQLKSAPADAVDCYARTFDALLDPKDGKLLKILSRWPKGVPPIAPQPPADSAETQMNNAGLEKYHAFPETEPLISFLEALDVVLKDGGLGNPLVAKQILAHYVVRSAMGREPKAVWAITLRGIPPFRAAYPGVPVDARNHARHIVDAKTGKWICAGTSPQPQTSEESEAQGKTQPSRGHP